jgi:hypothetical protein
MTKRARAGSGELRSAPLGLRIKPSLKEELDRLALADQRTLAGYVEMVLEAHVEAKKQEKKRR